ncbi:MAG: regulatory protein MarR [Gemmatimonadetes bacterium]|nr:regulatory protein MarR [Gemmatimonadota bacterium]
MDALRRLVRVLSSSAREHSGGNDVSGAQLFVLRTIGAAPGRSVGALAASTLARQSTVSEVVSRLVERGYVERTVSATDAREARLSLTARGRRAIAGSALTVQERLASGLATLTPARRGALAGGLEAWLEAAGLADVPPRMFFDEPAPSTTRTRARSTRRGESA